jgi:hypothetical protein
MPIRDPLGEAAVLAPELTFRNLDAALAAAGFALVEEVCFGTGPEPDRASWRRGAAGVRLIRDLATGIRVLVPENGATLPDGVPLLTPAAILDLLHAPDVTSRLAGLQAAAAMPDASLGPAVARCVRDAEPRVVEHAMAALSAIAAELPGAAAARDPAAALFSLPGWRREKLQIMRWLAQDGAPADRVEALLARALADADWEIAMTAMLAAARLNVRALAPQIARLSIPEGRRHGLTAPEHRLLLALRDGCLAHLGTDRGRILPTGVAEAVAGNIDALAPAMAAFVCALTSPLPVAPPPPPTAAVTLAWDGPVLADGTLLVWVPPVPHWLGDDGLRGAEANPARRVVPQQGFYIDARPRGIGTYADACRATAALARRIGRPAALPSPDQWVMAARGPDGRRFPWGANGADSARVDLSPWDMAGVASGPGEWLAEARQATALATGGGAVPIPAWRERADCELFHYYRSVYVLI